MTKIQFKKKLLAFVAIFILTSNQDCVATDFPSATAHALLEAFLRTSNPPCTSSSPRQLYALASVAALAAITRFWLIKKAPLSFRNRSYVNLFLTCVAQFILEALSGTTLLTGSNRGLLNRLLSTTLSYAGKLNYFVLMYDGFHALYSTFPGAAEIIGSYFGFNPIKHGFEYIPPANITNTVEKLVISPTVTKKILDETLVPFFDQNHTNHALVEGCGAVFYGVPGTGKSTYAKALAKQLGIPVILVSGPTLQGFYLGEGASKVRELFKFAKEVAPVIIIIDEIDAIVKNRSNFHASQNAEYYTATTNAMLAETDKLNILPKNRRVFVIGTTNGTGNYDPALTRPGRMSTLIRFDNPKKVGREKLTTLYWEQYCPKLNLRQQWHSLIVEMTDGKSPAVIEALIKDLAKKTNTNLEISAKQIIDSLLVIDCGPVDPEEQQVTSTKTANLVAWHEAGHLVAGLLNLPNAVQLFKYVSIEPRTGGSGGLTCFTPPPEPYHNQRDFEAIIAMTFGGGLGEELINKAPVYSSGVGSDYDSINKILKAMWELGMLPEATANSSDKVKAAAMDKKFFEIRDKTRAELAQPMATEAVKAIAEKLIAKKVLDNADVIVIPEVKRLLEVKNIEIPTPKFDPMNYPHPMGLNDQLDYPTGPIFTPSPKAT